MANVLTKNQIEQFMELGWVKLEQAYSEKDALAAQQIIWQGLEREGVSQHDQSTWTKPYIRLEDSYDTPEFRSCNTDRLADAVEDLVGEGRWGGRGKHVGWGGWPVNFAVGADQPWTVPTRGWHYDGIHFRHFINSPDQGILLLCLFSEVGPKAGGSVVAEGSHNIVAKILNEHPEGLQLGEAIQKANQHPWLAELTGTLSKAESSTKDIYAEKAEEKSIDEKWAQDRIDKFMNKEYHDPAGFSLRVVETTGGPGDIFLCHPFLYHSASQNHSGKPRFMCNRVTPLKEKMNLYRSNEKDYSPVEYSIRKAITT